MIQANELRIGSFVLLKGETIKWDIQRFWMIEEGVGLYEEDYDPIPLTPEIFEKAGFVKGSTVGYWEGGKNIPTIEYCKDDFRIMQRVESDWSVCIAYETEITKIKYVHQLQNLFFTLTGEELNITL